MKHYPLITILSICLFVTISAAALAQQAPVTPDVTTVATAVLMLDSKATDTNLEDALPTLIRRAMREANVSGSFLIVQNLSYVKGSTTAVPILINRYSAADMQELLSSVNKGAPTSATTTTQNTTGASIGATASQTNGSGSGGGVVPAYTVSGRNYTMTFSYNTASAQTITTTNSNATTGAAASSSLGSALLNPGSETQSFNILSFFTNYHTPKHDDDATDKQNLLVDIQNETKTYLDEEYSNSVTPPPTPTPNDELWNAFASLTTGKETDVDTTRLDASGVGVRLNGGNLNFTGADPTSSTATKTESGGVIVCSIGYQRLTSGSDSQADKIITGFKIGPTVHQIIGDVAQDSSFRNANFGTRNNTYLGGELTFFAKIGTVTPYVRITYMPNSNAISGFTGTQMVIGVDAFSETF